MDFWTQIAQIKGWNYFLISLIYAKSLFL